MTMENKTIERIMKLQTLDEKVVDVSKKVIEKLVMIKEMVLDEFETDEFWQKQEIVPLKNISSNTLNLIIKFVELGDDTTGEESETKKERDSKKEKFFNGVEKHDLFDVLTATNFLNYKEMLKVGCKHVANYIKGKTPNEMREYFEVEDDFTPEERKELNIEE